MVVVEIVFWASIAALVWTHVAYPVTARVLARIRPRPVVNDTGELPRVVVIVAAAAPS